MRHERIASRPPDATESAEMTELLHHLQFTEVARVHRGESDGAPGLNHAAPKEFAAALPIWKRLLDLFIVALLFPFWLPIMTLSALWVAITSPGPVFTGNRVSDSKAGVSCS